MSQINNPKGAFGYPVLTPRSGYEPVPLVASAAIAQGNLVQLTGTQGQIVSAITNGVNSAFIGVALEAADAAGDVINVAYVGPAVANKHVGAAMTAGDRVSVSATTNGQVYSVAGTVAVTQAQHLGMVVGVAVADATANDTTVLLFLI